MTGVNCHHHTGLNQSLHLLHWIIAQRVPFGKMSDVCTRNTRHGHPINDPASQLNLTVEGIAAVVQQSAGGNCSVLGGIVGEIMNKLINLPQNVDTGAPLVGRVI